MSERVIRVQPSELNAQALKITTEKSSFNASYSDIVSQSNYLTTTSWGGVDADNFNEKVKQFKKDFEQMETILGQYIEFLKKSANAYTTAQNDVNEQISSLETKVK